MIMIKSILKYVLIGFASLFIFLYLHGKYEYHYDKKEIRAQANGKNIKKIKEGMLVDEVTVIMGIPYDTINVRGELHYFYSVPSGSSESCVVAFKNDSVVKTFTW